MSDKRKSARIAVNHEFQSVAQFLREYALNVSEGGVFIRTADVLPVGTDVSLRFSIIVDDFETIEGEGQVVRAVHVGGREPPGMGVVFTSLTPASRDAIARLFVRRPPQTG